MTLAAGSSIALKASPMEPTTSAVVLAASAMAYFEKVIELRLLVIKSF
jgi:hypothetical protein